MDRLIVLDIRRGAGAEIIHPVVLADGKNTVLIDCGYPDSLPAIEEALEANGLSCAGLTHVLVTHQDHDHMGALAALKEKHPKIQVVASKTEAPYISGQLKSLRLAQAEAIQEHLPEEQKPFGLAFCAMLREVRPAAVDVEVQDGDGLDWCGGCTVIGTPGHTPGHISLFVRREKTLIAGDAVALTQGSPVVANPQFALNLAGAEASFARSMALGAEKIICYHGGVLIP